jgi:hypothetical protein
MLACALVLGIIIWALFHYSDYQFVLVPGFAIYPHSAFVGMLCALFFIDLVAFMFATMTQVLIDIVRINRARM